MLKKLVRHLSYYRKLETFQEFNSAGANLPRNKKFTKQEQGVERFERSVVAREDHLDHRDFYTESSDFDVEAFSLKEYLWECMLFQKPSIFKFLIGIFSWQVILFIGLSVTYLAKKVLLKLSPVSYFEMVSPAYIDMQLVRYKQRLKFKKLHEYD